MRVNRNHGMVVHLTSQFTQRTLEWSFSIGEWIHDHFPFDAETWAEWPADSENQWSSCSLLQKFKGEGEEAKDWPAEGASKKDGLAKGAKTEKKAWVGLMLSRAMELWLHLPSDSARRFEPRVTISTYKILTKGKNSEYLPFTVEIQDKWCKVIHLRADESVLMGHIATNSLHHS